MTNLSCCAVGNDKRMTIYPQKERSIRCFHIDDLCDNTGADTQNSGVFCGVSSLVDVL